MTIEENHEKRSGPWNSKLTLKNGKDAIKWRRARVLELDSQGYTYDEIVTKLQIAKGTVSNDIAFLKRQAQANLEYHIHHVIPYECEKALAGMKMNLKHILEIAETATDPRVRLQARDTANDCYDKIINLITNGVIVSDAFNRITEIKKDMKVLTRLDESMKADAKELAEAEMTTNGVF